MQKQKGLSASLYMSLVSILEPPTREKKNFTCCQDKTTWLACSSVVLQRRHGTFLLSFWCGVGPLVLKSGYESEIAVMDKFLPYGFLEKQIWEFDTRLSWLLCFLMKSVFKSLTPDRAHHTILSEWGANARFRPWISPISHSFHKKQMVYSSVFCIKFCLSNLCLLNSAKVYFVISNDAI